MNKSKILLSIFTAFVAFGFLMPNYSYAKYNYAEHKNDFITLNDKEHNSVGDISSIEAYRNFEEQELNKWASKGHYILDNTPIEILNLQKKVADVNGLVVTSKRFLKEYDEYVNPIKMLSNYNNANCIGEGRIFLGTKYIENNGFNKNNNFIGDGVVAETIAHETGHSVLNHGNFHNKPTDEKKLNELRDNQEYDADKFALFTLEKIPEFGWGHSFIISHYLSDVLRREKIAEYMEKESKGFLRMGYCHIGEGDAVSFQFSDGIWGFQEFLDIDVKKRGWDLSKDNQFREKVEFAIAQLGFIYSRVNKIEGNHVSFERTDANDSRYGKTRLVYRDSRLPSGYKVIGYFGMDYDSLMKTVNALATDEEGTLSTFPDRPGEEAMVFALMRTCVIASMK